MFVKHADVVVLVDHFSTAKLLTAKTYKYYFKSCSISLICYANSKE